VESQSVQFVSIPIWIAVPVLVIVLVGGWKLAKLLWAAISN
jgi:hypothetical protein